MPTSTETILELIKNANGRSNSFIFSGAEGISAVARQIICKLLETDDLAVHTNVLWIDTLQKNVGVDEVRNIDSFMYRTTYHAHLPKIIVIDCVDNLNLHSFNALLKILEEPTKNTYFMLLSQNLEALPDTIRSRCIIVKSPPPASSSKEEHLEVYRQLLEFLPIDNKAPTRLYSFIEKSFSTLEQLEIFQVLIKNLLSKAIKRSANLEVQTIAEENIILEFIKATNVRQLSLLAQEIDSLLSNTKTLGLDIKSVVLIVLYKINSLIKP
jgi:DNA polymerase-3 subunit delta'